MNKPQLIIFLLLAGLSSASLFAQDNPHEFSYQLSYYGNNLWNPGLSIGMEYSNSTREKNDRKGSEYLIQNHYSLDLASYVDFGSHAAILLYSGLNIERINDDKLDFSFGFSPLGIYRSFLPQTYSVSDEGEATPVNLPGRTYYAPTISFGIGNPLPQDSLEAWFMELDVTSLIPYNTYLMFLLNVKLGVKF